MFYVEFTTGSIQINEITPTSPMTYAKDGSFYFEFIP